MVSTLFFKIPYISDSIQYLGFPGGSDGKESVCNAGALGLIPGSGRSPGERNGYLLQWEIPWTEEPGRLQFVGSQESNMT